MDLERFRHSPIGRLVPVSGYDARYGEYYEHAAYIPDPLPPQIDLTPATHTAVGEAMLALGRLDGAASRFPNPFLLVRPAIRREAVSTSALEGTYTAFQEVLEADYLEEGELAANVSEVRNFVRAAEYGVEAVRTRPISMRLLSELHKMLVRGTPGDSHEAGQVRTNQVLIGTDGCKVTEARFVPPPPGDILIAGVSAWEKWINDDSDRIPFLVGVAVGHYQFETLHPYRDGNGRLGRLVALLQMVDTGRLRTPVLNVSPWLQERRDTYLDHLASVTETGDFNPWVAFFAEAVYAQAQLEEERIARLLALKDDLVERVRSRGIRSAAVPIAEQLIGFPVISVRRAAENNNVSYQTANSAIATLADIGVVANLGDRRYDRLFYAPEVIAVLERQPARSAPDQSGRSKDPAT